MRTENLLMMPKRFGLYMDVNELQISGTRLAFGQVLFTENSSMESIHNFGYLFASVEGLADGRGSSTRKLSAQSWCRIRGEGTGKSSTELNPD